MRDLDELRSILAVEPFAPQVFWRARTIDELDHMAGSALTELSIWSRPAPHWSDGERDQARARYFAYAISSTYDLRRREMRELALMKLDLAR